MEQRRRKRCRLCADKIDVVSCEDVGKLRRYLSDRGKIIPRRVSGVCAKHQRQLSRAIKRAREMALLPYVSRFHR